MIHELGVRSKGQDLDTESGLSAPGTSQVHNPGQCSPEHPSPEYYGRFHQMSLEIKSGFCSVGVID